MTRGGEYFERSGRCTRRPNYVKSGQQEREMVIPCDVRTMVQGLQLVARGDKIMRQVPRKIRVRDRSLEEIIMAQDQQTRKRLEGMLKDIQVMEGLAEALAKGDIVMACDGSMKMGRNTYAICVGDAGEIQRFTMAREIEG